MIGLGGGSPIDSAKAMAVLAVHGGKMRDYKAPHVQDEAGLPIIAIPTTAGTGSEATRFTIITDDERDEKMLCIGLAFLPIAALVDYELTLSMPARLTADTGVDAITHAIEAYVSRRANPFADALALAAMRTLWDNIRVAYTDPADRNAREKMMLGATQAGIAFSNSSVALVHGMSRAMVRLSPRARALERDAAPGGDCVLGRRRTRALRRMRAQPAPRRRRYERCRRRQGVVDALFRLNADLAVPGRARSGSRRRAGKR